MSLQYVVVSPRQSQPSKGKKEENASWHPMPDCHRKLPCQYRTFFFLSSSRPTAAPLRFKSKYLGNQSKKTANQTAFAPVNPPVPLPCFLFFSIFFLCGVSSGSFLNLRLCTRSLPYLNFFSNQSNSQNYAHLDDRRGDFRPKPTRSCCFCSNGHPEGGRKNRLPRNTDRRFYSFSIGD